MRKLCKLHIGESRRENMAGSRQCTTQEGVSRIWEGGTEAGRTLKVYFAREYFPF